MCACQAPGGPLTLTHSPHPSGPAAGPAIPTSNSYSKKTQSNNAENKRPEEDRESGRKASSTAKVPASPLPGLERKKTTPTPSTVSVPPGPPPASPTPFPAPSCSGACPIQASPSGRPLDLTSRATFAYYRKPTPKRKSRILSFLCPCLLLLGGRGEASSVNRTLRFSVIQLCPLLPTEQRPLHQHKSKQEFPTFGEGQPWSGLHPERQRQVS